MNHFLAMAAIVKNEGRYLREWIEFHRLMGVEHFYIYDNGSTDNTPEILEPYVRTGLVTATAWPGQVQQLLAYVHAIGKAREDGVEWLAVIDADEYLWTPRGSTIGEDGKPLYNVSDVLAAPQFDGGDVPAIAVNWSVFGTGGHDRRPDGLVIESYVSCVRRQDPVNLHVKSIVKPHYVLEVMPPDPHHFAYVGDRPARNEDGVGVRGPLSSMWVGDTFRVNHYWSKSREDAELKAQVARADNGMLRDVEEMTSDKYNALVDTGITVHVPALCAALGTDCPPGTRA
jgi:glycosyltransferase involved in cell wall biosynthesis